MLSYLFYDLETTGLNKAFDQILQFAAIRTDINLNEIERYSIIIKLRPDIIPSPIATITHKISICESLKGINEYEAVKTIHKMMNKPGTISCGYNTMGFDDEFLRFSFYRNLLSPYTHQYANKCGRMDLLPITVIFRLYKSDIIKWPEKNNKFSLKLEHINENNQLAQGQAHDAMVDVNATVALVRIFSQEKKMWGYLLENFDKNKDNERINQLPNIFESEAGIHHFGLMTGSVFGSEMKYQAPVLSIGNSIPYKNQSLWLRLDLPELCSANNETIPENSWVIRKKMGEPDFILPPKPRFMENISEERKKIIEQNKTWIQKNPEIFQNIITYHREFKYEEIPDLDIDAALYQNGFLTRKEEEIDKKFHLYNLDKKIAYLKNFTNPGQKELAKRVLCKNFPDDVPDDLKNNFKEYLKKLNPDNNEKARIDYMGSKHITPRDALNQIEEIKNNEKINLDKKQSEILEELKNYLKATFF